ncbi:MAG: hypothetical protein LBQ41_01150 [Candidatus Ancillula sp.]|jgi:hypothetical protein|nr:hypothetical protein [Candidatus Ancillula sp.]
MTDENKDKNVTDAVTESLTTAIDAINKAKEAATKRFEELKNEMPEEPTVKVVATQVTEILGQSAAKVKAAYDEAGGYDGISEKTVSNVAKLGASVKVVSEQVADSDAFKQAVKSAKEGAVKLQETNFFAKLKAEAERLKTIATETYTQAYDEHKKGTDQDSAA